MSVVDEILGCPLLEITRSWWAIKLENGTYRCQRSRVHNWRAGTWRYLDWYEDIVATSEHKLITEIWLFCPTNRTSPLGNTARMPIPVRARGFELNITQVDTSLFGPGQAQYQAHIIGRAEDDDGNCICIAWDPIEGGMLTYDTTIYDPAEKSVALNDDGSVYYPLRTNVYRFGWRIKRGRLVNGMWRESLAPLGKLALDRLGVAL
jgi:hypothetical protein